MKITRKNKALGTFNAAPMNDIIFFLLLFFLLTSSFIQQAAINVVLPKAVDLADKTKSGPSITITADSTYMWQEEELLPGATVQEKEKAVFVKIDAYFADSSRSSDVIVLNLDRTVDIGSATPIMGYVGAKEGALSLRVEK